LYDVEMVSTRRLGRVLKGMLHAFVREHGASALLPERKTPMTREILCAMLARPFDPNDPSALAFRAMMCVCFQAGFRKSEVCIPDDAVLGRDRLCRSALRWSVGGRLYAALTPDLHRRLQRGDAAVLVPPPSKNDPFSVLFGGVPIYLPFDPVQPFSAARHLADLELRCPCAHRTLAPLFAVDGRSAPFRHSRADACLRALLAEVLPVADAKKYSMHSFRVGLACAPRGGRHARPDPLLVSLGTQQLVRHTVRSSQPGNLSQLDLARGPRRSDFRHVLQPSSHRQRRRRSRHVSS
ncbi:MAG: hypothetical protein AAF368_16695, partial [Planctomycetota bacterium]